MGEFKEYCVALFGPIIYNAPAAKARGNIGAAAYGATKNAPDARGVC